jgi:hypothetical protein
MCRNIRVLHHFEPPTTPEEVAAAALQYVRKVSGLAKPTAASARAFEKAVREVSRATQALLDALPDAAAPRTREGERAKGRLRWERRAAALTRSGG